MLRPLERHSEALSLGNPFKKPVEVNFIQLFQPPPRPLRLWYSRSESANMFIREAADSLFNMTSRKIEFENFFWRPPWDPFRGPQGRFWQDFLWNCFSKRFKGNFLQLVQVPPWLPRLWYLRSGSPNMFIRDPVDSFFNMVSRKIEFEKFFWRPSWDPFRGPSGRISFEIASESDLKAIFFS